MNLSKLPSYCLFGFVVLGSAVVHLVMAACTPKFTGKESPLLEDKVTSSDAVVRGVVTKHVKDSALPGAYTAVMDVHCVYRGGPLPPVINIINAGDWFK
ncbi:hypothetical protein BaRGS_00034014 [Batillaria attramentaria]|uniref:Uncharacterized protein n=1 Tax=Batillaria attramentaria TaxID=370345 RepID=A0ABD0JJ84_9CAEN